MGWLWLRSSEGCAASSMPQASCWRKKLWQNGPHDFDAFMRVIRINLANLHVTRLAAAVMRTSKRRLRARVGHHQYGIGRGV